MGLTKLGIGTWPIGHDGLRAPWDRRNPKLLQPILERAFEMGIDWIDTAHSYDDGVAEEAVGRFIARLPNDIRPSLLTKGGTVRDLAAHRSRPTAVLRPSVIRGQLEASLRRLGVDAVDMYLLHHPDETGVPVEESWGEVQRLVREGLVRHAGLCGFPIDAVARCAMEGRVEIVMQRLSPLDFEASAAHMDLCRQLGCRFITWNPTKTGRLLDPAAAGPLAGTPFDTPGNRLEELAASDIGREMAVTNAILGIARGRGVSPEAIVVAWQLSQDGVSAVAIGPEHAAQIDRYVPGDTLCLSCDEIEEIGSAAESRQYGRLLA